MPKYSIAHFIKQIILVSLKPLRLPVLFSADILKLNSSVGFVGMPIWLETSALDFIFMRFHVDALPFRFTDAQRNKSFLFYLCRIANKLKIYNH